MYLKKKELVEWLEQRASNLHWGARQVDHHEIIDKIESGAFDAPDMEHINAYWAREGLIEKQQEEVQRLRETIEQICKEVDENCLGIFAIHIREMADEALNAGMEKGAEG